MGWLRRLDGWLRPAMGVRDVAAELALGERAASHTAHTDLSDLRQRLTAAKTPFPDDLLLDFLAWIRDVATASVGLTPYPVQLAATAALLRGTSIQQATGEGKTLVGAMAAVGFVLSGRTVHVLSVNDYLAERDATWMGPLYVAADIDARFVTSHTEQPHRRDAYASEVVYVPVSEAGFDLLRDRCAASVDEIVSGKRDVVIVDEADAVLIDEATVPLVLAGEVAPDDLGVDIASFARTFTKDDYETDAERRNIFLTDAGIAKVENYYPGVDLFGAEDAVLSDVLLGLHAEVLLTRDVDYLVSEGTIKVINQARGRIEELQRWPEGLHRALEAKEGLASSRTTVVMDQVLIEELMVHYDTVVGMSGTLIDVAAELAEFYRMEVGAFGSHRPCQRSDDPEQLYATRAERDQAAVALVRDLAPRPILVACQTVAESERITQMLRADGLAPLLLNAKNDAEEADLISQAGRLGSVVVSTQMAGRGTDIVLDDDACVAGGLAVIGIGRFPSARLDDQLRGRSGRQGDPGSSIFLTSLEDDLVTRCDDVAYPTGLHGLLTDKKTKRIPHHAQAVAEGQRDGLHRLSRRYQQLPALQRREVGQRRAQLFDDDCGALLAAEDSEHWDMIVTIMGVTAAEEAARAVLLACVDAEWRAHLADIHVLREGIHLRALAKRQPIDAFIAEVSLLHQGWWQRVLDRASVAVEACALAKRPLTIPPSVSRPSATWTHMVTDDHFGSDWERLGRMLQRAVAR